MGGRDHIQDLIDRITNEMKRWILLFCCLGALGWATAQFSGTLTQGIFDSIIIDFREEVGDSQIQEAMGEASKLLDLTPRLNSEFSEGDHPVVRYFQVRHFPAGPAKSKRQ